MWGFVSKWIQATLVGWVLALLTIFVFEVLGWELVVAILHRIGLSSLYTLSDVLSLLAASLAAIVAGYSQWKIALQGWIPKWYWIASSVVTLLLTWLTLGWIAGRIPQFIDGAGGNLDGLDTTYRLLDTWPMAILIFGVSFGIAIGIPQWVALHLSGHRIYWWPGITILGFLGALSVTFLIIAIFQNVILVDCLSCLIAPVTFALITGIGLFRILGAKSKSSTNTLIVPQR